jgi:hypothetical protein
LTDEPEEEDCEAYQIPGPRTCFRCGEDCYARDWFDHTTTGRYYGRDVVKVYWQCSECGRRFETMEHLDAILIEVDELPKYYKKISYINPDDDEKYEA